MNFKVFVTILTFFIEHQVTRAQNVTLECNYIMNWSSEYTCKLNIDNPKGRNDTDKINGTHFGGKVDADVQALYIMWGPDSINLPSILCNTFINIQTIFVDGIGLEKVDENSFKGCKALSSLDLRNNNISDINENSFIENLVSKNFNLAQNQIKALPENIFKSQSKLETLDLHQNNITDLPANIFKSLQKLRKLNLGGNQISTLKVEWFVPLVSLENLYLHENQLEYFPKNAFSSMKNLTYIEIAHNKFKIINSEAFSVQPKLKFISASFNQIGAIDEKLINKTGITRLDTKGSICANKDIQDASVTRETMLVELKVCFANFIKLQPICSKENLDLRICKLEDKIEKCEKNTEKFMEQIGEFRTTIKNILADAILKLEKIVK